MDPKRISRNLSAYAENKRIFEIFQNMFERIVVNRPESPVDFLYDLLVKRAVYDVPRVFVLGYTSNNRRQVCAALQSKLHLIYLTQNNLETETREENSKELKDQTDDSKWANLLKKRIETADCESKGWLVEDFPKSRKQASALRRAGVFPTHIVVIDDLDVEGGPKKSDEKKEDFEKNSEHKEQIDLILDLHDKSYVKKFNVGNFDKVEKFLEEVLEFVRSKQRSTSPYLPRVLLLGPCGSGRKTVAKQLSEKLEIIEVDYREELRRAALRDSPLKEKLIDVLKTSEPVPDELLVKVASERLLREDCIKSGWIIYNFPDTKTQVQLLVKALEGFQINRAIFLDASLQTCQERVQTRNTSAEDIEDYVKAEHEMHQENVQGVKEFFRTQMLDDIVTEVDGDCGVQKVFEAVQDAVLKGAKMKWPEEESTEKV